MRRTLPPSRPRARHSHPSPPRLDALRVLTLELCVCLLPLLLRLPTSTRARRPWATTFPSCYAHHFALYAKLNHDILLKRWRCAQVTDLGTPPNLHQIVMVGTCLTTTLWAVVGRARGARPAPRVPRPGRRGLRHAELERPGRGGRRVHVHPGHVRNGPLRVRAERPVGQARRDHHRRGDGHREDDAYPDAFLPHTDNMDNMAIVFHCNTGASERAFCAKIQYTQLSTAPTWRPSWPTAPR